MDQLDIVPIIDVHKDNFKQLWPGMLLAIRSSTYVAIDTELSGLGNRKCLNAKDIDDRFKTLSEVSKSHSILSLGLSCFKLLPNCNSDHLVSDNSQMESENLSEELLNIPQTWSILINELKTSKANLTFQVQTYNITLLCSESYVVEPESLTFLVEHGFDFNKQYSLGVPYYRGANKVGEKIDQSVRYLFGELILSKVPVVFHNAFVDLVFLYHNLYTSLPPTLNMFLSDLSEIFQGGVYDTKFISEFFIRWPASYLEYVFRKSLRENELKTTQNSRHIQIKFLKYAKSVSYVDYKDCSKTINKEHDPPQKDVCPIFAAHGWCKSGPHCLQSHNMEYILNEEWSKQSKKKRRSKKQKEANELQNSTVMEEVTNSCELFQSPVNNVGNGEKNENINSKTTSPDTSIEMKNGESFENSACLNAIEMELEDNQSDLLPRANLQQTAGHRAGVDAFMTGFTMALFILKHDRQTQKLLEMNNKICLSGKQHPLQIFKSQFSKISKDHTEKMAQLMANKL